MAAVDPVIPTVLLHGWGSTAGRTWSHNPLMQRLLSTGRRIYTPDLPGHGIGEHQHSDPSAFLDLVAQTSRLIPEEVRDGVGYSLGGKLLLWMELADPGRFRKLVIAGVGDNIFTPEAGGYITELLTRKQVPTLPQDVHDLVLEARVSGNCAATIGAVITRPGTPPPIDDFDRIQADVLLIGGTADTIAKEPAALARAIPRAHLEVIPGVNHRSLLSSPKFTTAAARFLDG